MMRQASADKLKSHVPLQGSGLALGPDCDGLLNYCTDTEAVEQKPLAKHFDLQHLLASVALDRESPCAEPPPALRTHAKRFQLQVRPSPWPTVGVGS